MKYEAQLKNRERIHNTQAEHKAHFPGLANYEGDVETIRLEENELENGDGGPQIDHKLQNITKQDLDISSGLTIVILECHVI